ncbi:efflux RND transporter periplasmic adaptor subunit [Rubrimonas cliftonensis]|uniref:RND family efflux transporter, MFP subunit n=1 Tax=Rubrimonas cliftonensis TaxID=89524 RepID=A0A1H3VHY7_9RHOB|nr:efflux RND transporter periplasmic adaptor subunit [Rubrimonas cliftonensis]SDZ74413.1 RND family efflux transporter, MFP subunit [Rubrimonas cliftonensis]
MRTLLRAVAGAAVAVSFALCGLAQDRPAGVVVDAVDVRMLEETAPVLGRLVAATRSVVAARTAGVVAAAPVRVGDRVRRGDLLARIDTERLEIAERVAGAALAQAEASREAAQADVALAAQALERISGLRGSSAFSSGAFEDRRTELARARSRVGAAAAAAERARADVAQAEYDLAYAATRAPFDGVVIERSAQPGAYLQTGAPVATLLDLSDLEIEADIPAEYVSALSEGMTVEAVVGASHVVRAALRAIVPEEAVSTRTRPARFTLESGALNGATAAGQSIALSIPTAPARAALTVAKDALVQSSRGWTVFVAVDGAAEARDVRIGAPVGQRMEVLDGLSEGEWVVVRGNERLRPGQPIDPATADGDRVAARAAAKG